MTQGHIIISLAFLDGHSGEIYNELTLAMSHFVKKGEMGWGVVLKQKGGGGAETKRGRRC